MRLLRGADRVAITDGFAWGGKLKTRAVSEP